MTDLWADKQKLKEENRRKFITPLPDATFYTVGWLLKIDELICQSDLSTEQRSIFDFILTE